MFKFSKLLDAFGAWFQGRRQKCARVLGNDIINLRRICWMELDIVCNVKGQQEGPGIANDFNSRNSSDKDTFSSTQTESDGFHRPGEGVSAQNAEFWYRECNFQPAPVTYFLGTTILSSSGVSNCVNVPGTRRPGVSYSVRPSPRSTLMNSRVVPGRALTVTAPFFLLS
mmetsp:Transcript_9940/g.22965  ORF Transcript_9940/g.22965 Transcript_9940/m.22965 type:complete len:169 (+) Transcript_9940:297-803(+)